MPTIDKKRRHQLRKRLRMEGWPPGVSIPSELLDHLVQADANGKEEPPREAEH